MEKILKRKHIEIPLGDISLKANVHIPVKPKGLVVFSHGSGSSRLSPRNREVAEDLENKEFATLLFDLLTEEEDMEYQNRFDIDLLTGRLIALSNWLREQSEYKQMEIGYFGSSTGAASALRAAASLGPDIIKAVVARGGRPDLAMNELEEVNSPTLLIVGGLDSEVIEMNQIALKKLHCVKELKIVPGATHLFEEPGKLEEVTKFAGDWFEEHFNW